MSDTTSRDASVFDEPRALATIVLALPRPLLIVFDCDGVLAPLTDHADDSVLNPGIGEDLAALAAVDGIDVAILSGRSLKGLEQFAFDDSIAVAGSYGGERRGRSPEPLTPEEQRRLAAIDDVLEAAVDVGGAGAWIERKPTSSVLHVREADPDSGRAAVELVHERQRVLRGHECHDGDNVVELMARPANKGNGLRALRNEFAPTSVVYLGDDLPDEEAFAVLSPDDVGIKVGTGASIAPYRVADPDAITELIVALRTAAQNRDA